MTRKHFTAVAITLGYQLRGYQPKSPEWNAVVDTATALCHDFKVANTNFNRDTFLGFMFDVAEGRRDLDGKKVAA